MLSFEWLPARVLMTHLIHAVGREPKIVQLDSSVLTQSRMITVERDIIYRQVTNDTQRLDIYRPGGPTPQTGRPVLLAIHGGGWSKFDKSDYGPKIAVLARQGFLVIAPDYPLSKRGAPSWPTNFQALRDSVRWIRMNAATIGADPNRITAIGESAGGHLAQLLGTSPDEISLTDRFSGISSRVNAVVSFYGPSDLVALDRQSSLASARIRSLIGASPTQSPERYLASSPISQVTSDDAPMFLVHGRSDTLVPPSQSIRMARETQKQGVLTRLVILRNAGHGFGLGGGKRSLAQAIGSFLRRVYG